MRIALIGCNSLLAGYLIERFLTEPAVNLLLLSRQPPPASRLDARCQFQRFDYPTVPLRIAELLGCDAIIYCAAGGVQAGETITPAATTDINYEVPAGLFSALVQHQYRGRWVSFGTYFELGETPGRQPATEGDLVSGIYKVPNAYCESKRRLTGFMAAQSPSFRAWHLILPTIYGAREHTDRLIPYLVRSLRQGQTPQLSAGTQVRQYIHGRDVAELVALLLSRSVSGGIYNVAGPDVLPIKDLVEMVFMHFGQNAAEALGAVQTRDESMPRLQLDGRKLARALPDWLPHWPLSIGLAEYF